MNSLRHIGILQYSVEGAMLCYATAMREAIARLGPHHHPRITMAGLAMGDTIDAWNSNDLVQLRAGSAEVIDRLAAGGADFFVVPDNTSHIALEHPGPPFALPGLNIAQIVICNAKARGFTKLGILGTRWTMEGPVYARACARHDLDFAVPDDATRAELHRIIIDELCMNQCAVESIEYYRSAIARLADGGCDCVALVCTEIPLIINDDNSALPVLDSTRLLARAAVDVALGQAPLPSWRGGPFA